MSLIGTISLTIGVAIVKYLTAGLVGDGVQSQIAQDSLDVAREQIDGKTENPCFFSVCSASSLRTLCNGFSLEPPTPPQFPPPRHLRIRPVLNWMGYEDSGWCKPQRGGLRLRRFHKPARGNHHLGTPIVMKIIMKNIRIKHIYIYILIRIC